MKILISRKHWNKIINYSSSAYNQFKTEIGGMAVCCENKEGNWVIHDPVILKQEVTGSNTHLKKKELAIYYTEAHHKYSKLNYRFLWWHSHHTMDAFWSGTDLNTIDEFKEGDFSFALVVNLKEEYKCRISVWKPIEIHEDVELTIIDNKNVNTSIDEEVKNLCTKEVVYSVLQNNLWNRNGYNRHLSDESSKAFSQSEINLSSDNEEVLQWLTEQCENTLHDMSYGLNGFKELCSKFKAINKEMKKYKTSFRLEIPKKEEADVLYTAEAYHFIIPKDSKDGQSVVDLNTFIDTIDWNGSYVQ